MASFAGARAAGRVAASAAAAGGAALAGQPSSAHADAGAHDDPTWFSLPDELPIEDGKRMIFGSSREGSVRSFDGGDGGCVVVGAAGGVGAGAMIAVDHDSAKQIVDLGSSLADDPRVQEAVLEKLGLRKELAAGGVGRKMILPREGRAGLERGLQKQLHEAQKMIHEQQEEILDQQDLNEALNLHSDRVRGPRNGCLLSNNANRLFVACFRQYIPLCINWLAAGASVANASSAVPVSDTPVLSPRSCLRTTGFASALLASSIA